MLQIVSIQEFKYTKLMKQKNLKLIFMKREKRNDSDRGFRSDYLKIIQILKHFEEDFFFHIGFIRALVTCILVIFAQNK